MSTTTAIRDGQWPRGLPAPQSEVGSRRTLPTFTTNGVIREVTVGTTFRSRRVPLGEIGGGQAARQMLRMILVPRRIRGQSRIASSADRTPPRVLRLSK